MSDKKPTEKLIFDKKKIALELAIKSQGKPIMRETLIKTAKTIFDWLIEEDQTTKP